MTSEKKKSAFSCQTSVTVIGNKSMKNEVEKPTEVNARQIVLRGDFLSTQVFLDGDGVVRSSFDSGIVGNHDTLYPIKINHNI